MSNSTSVHLSDLIRRYRSLEGLSQEQLAERSGLSTRQISDLERGLRTMPRLETIRLLADGLQLGEQDRAGLLLAARPGIQAISARLATTARAAGADSPADGDRRAALPIPPTPMIGRDDETDRLLALLLDSDCRLVTVTGPGGVGKTRLAVEVARRAAPNFTWGAVFVDLVPATGPDTVAWAIAQAVGAEESSHATVGESLRATLAPRETLLVVDNVEHVLEAAPLLGELLAACPGVRIVATSRAALRLRGETLFDLRPLAVPADPETDDLEVLAANPSVALFVEEARRAARDFFLTPDNAAVVARICRRLDGLPLAIELAAARVRLFGPALLDERLDHRLSLLLDGPRDLPARQRTLRDAIAWSHALLTPAEQGLLRRLAVFAGGAQLDSIEAVNATAASTGEATWVVLSSLVDKSLVRRGDDFGGRPRFSMLETIREFALEQLVRSGDEEAVRGAHARHFLAFAEGRCRHFLERLFTFGARDRMVAELDNLRAALGWFDARGDVDDFVRMVVATNDYLLDRGLLSEAIALCRRAEELAAVRPVGDRARGQILSLLAYLTVASGDAASAESIARRSIDLLRSDPANADLLPSALVALAIALREQHRLPDALAAAAEALQRARECDDEYLAAHALYHAGKIRFFLGDQDPGLRQVEESLAVSRRIGAVGSVVMAVSFLAAVRIRFGEVREAAALLGEVSRVWQSGGNKVEAGAFWLGYAGALAAAAGLDEQAAILYGFGFTFTGYCGVRGTIKREFEGIVADLRARLDEAAFRELYDRGVALPLDEAVALAHDVFARIERGGRA
jgi:predicted ATPase/transcriptional regulator with XRE-family HTH domain